MAKGYTGAVGLKNSSGLPINPATEEKQDVIQGNHECPDNTSNIPLGIDEIYTGDWEDTLEYGGIVIGIKADQDSATDGLVVEWSADGITTDQDDVFTILANRGKVFTFTPAMRFFRIIYTNNGIAQGVFALQTIFKKNAFKPSSHRIQDSIVAEDDAELVKAVLSGEDQDNVFRNIRASEIGAVWTTDFLLEASRGNLPGYSIERKFGSIAAIQSSTPTDVWAYGITPGAESYTFSTTADTDRMSSSNAGDAGLEVTIVGLDMDGVEVSQTVALDGTDATTPVALPTPLWRTNRAFNSNGTDFIGNIYIFVNGATTGGVPNVVTTVRAYIPIGEGQTLQAIYTVPVGKTGYIQGLETSLTKAGGSTAVGGNFRGRTREFGKVFRTQDDFDLISTGSSNKTYNFPVPLPFPERTDFVSTVNVTNNGAGASWAFSIILIDD
jgi:hypothetical protein